MFDVSVISLSLFSIQDYQGMLICLYFTSIDFSWHEWLVPCNICTEMQGNALSCWFQHADAFIKHDPDLLKGIL